MLVKALAILLGLSLALNGATGYFNNRKKAQIEGLRNVVAELTQNNISLRSSLANQNIAVANWEVEGIVLQGKADDANTVILTMGTEHDIELAKLRNEIVGNTCPEAMDWMLEKAMER